MALRKRGKHGYWHAYYRAWERTPEGLRQKTVTVNLGTTDREVAKALETRLMQRAKQSSTEARVSAKLEAFLSGTTVTICKGKSTRQRLKIADALEHASKYGVVSEYIEKKWKRFVRESGVVYMDEVTTELARSYLEKLNLSGKNFNNTKSALNSVFKLLLTETGMYSSPFEYVLSRLASQPRHKTSRTISDRMRFLVLKRDNYKCCACGASPAKDPSVVLHVDHIIPWSKGGETTLDNLQTLCSKCNLGKSDTL